MIKDGGNGRENGDGAYQKPAAVGREGAVYAVAGCSGKTQGGSFNHPVMVTSLETLGSMLLDIDGNRLDAKFIDSNATVGDSFTILKGPAPPVANFSGTPTSGVTPLTVDFTNRSTGTITSRMWRFGDGATSSAANPNHTYQVAGNYTVSLTVVGPGGSNTLQQSNLIRVDPSPSDDDIPPTIPAGLAVSAVSCTHLSLSWQPSTDTGGSGLAGYRFFLDGQQIATTTASSYADEGRSPAANYCYRVVAFDGAGNTSAHSAQSCASTPFCPFALDGSWKKLKSKCKQTCSLKAKFLVENPSTDSPLTFSVQFYLSSDDDFDSGDAELQTAAPSRSVKPGKTAKVKLKAKLPEGISVAGKFVIAIIRAEGSPDEVIVTGPLPSFSCRRGLNAPKPWWPRSPADPTTSSAIPATPR